MDKYNQTLPDTWHGTSQGIDRGHFFQDPGKMILGRDRKNGGSIYVLHSIYRG